MDQECLPKTGYAQEQEMFAEMKNVLQRRKRAKWRLGLALIVAGKRGARRVT